MNRKLYLLQGGLLLLLCFLPSLFLLMYMLPRDSTFSKDFLRVMEEEQHEHARRHAQLQSVVDVK